MTHTPGTDRYRLDAALTAAGVPPDEVVDCQKLDGGTFNTVFQVRRTRGTDLVVKLAPPPGTPVLRYEQGLLATEARFFALAQNAVGVPVPVVLPPIDSSAPPPVDSLVMTRCPGVNWCELQESIDGEQRRRLRAELGRHVAALHTITGSAFGYPALSLGPLRSSWRAAFSDMVDAVLADAERFDVPLPRPSDRIRELFAAQSAVLDEVTTPCLVHFDLWDGNVLVEGAGTDDARIGALIDAERAFWGDPLADFVSLALFGDIEQDDDFLAGYRSAGGSVTFDAATRQRLTLYRSYLYLIMWVEAVPRGSDAARRAWLRQQVLRPLTATLAAWSGEKHGAPA